MKRLTVALTHSASCSCAFQENFEHAKAFNHLCERMSDDEFIASTQPTPISAPAASTDPAPSCTLLLGRAIIEVGPAFDISPAVLSDLRYQEEESSSALASRASRNDAGQNDGDDDDHDSEDDQYERENRDGTPASEIYRELGMESRGTQTDSELPEGWVFVNRGMVFDDAEPSTAVGRTVTDANGNPMEIPVVSSFVEFVLNGEGNDQHQVDDIDRNINVDIQISQASPNVPSSPVPDSEVGVELFQNVAFQRELAISGSISRQESIVEDLVASNEPRADEAMDVDVDVDLALEPQETRLLASMNESLPVLRPLDREPLFQSLALSRARQETASPRSSPAPEGIRA